MKPSHVLLALCGCLPGLLATPSYRNLWQFRKMILCVLPNSWPMMEYLDYGCYCGRGGSGIPVDDVDRCCQIHDQCYTDAKEYKACRPIIDHPYIEIYNYDCDKPTKTITCNNSENYACEMFICECDRVAAKCIAHAQYNKDNNKLPSKSCREAGPHRIHH